jgi:hypothetical protein
LIFAGAGVAGTITQVNSRAALNATDYIPWSVLGAEQKNFPASFVEQTHILDINVTISDANLASGTAHVFEHLIMVPNGTTWAGNLSEYPNVLFLGPPNTSPSDASGGLGPANGATDPITFSFASNMKAVGFQIQTNTYGAFAATMTAYSGLNGTGTPWGTVTVNGTSDSGATKGVFLGLKSNAWDIASVVVTATTNDGAGFGVNRLELVTVPEPSTLVAMAAGLALLAGRKWRRRENCV